MEWRFFAPLRMTPESCPGNEVKDLWQNNEQLDRWKQRAAQLKQEVHALALAYKDPRVPWYAKLLAACVVTYALSPIDLIPDFIPILGYLDDLILVPLGIYLVLKMIPDDVISECRQRAKTLADQKQPTNRLVVIVIVAIWLVLAALSVYFIIHVMRD